MEIIVAKTAGFCEGVQEAISRTQQAADKGKGPVYTLGPLVHNPQVISLLEAQGVRVAQRPEDVPGGTVVIRSHGIPPGVRQKLVDRGLEICDATCRRVARVHGLVKKYHGKGYLVVVLGDPGHAEVEGILGYAEGQAIVISRPEEANDLPDSTKVCLVAQTTQDRELFNEVVKALRTRYSSLKEIEIIIHDTICSSTRERQEEVREIAKKVQAMIVVGGKNSANTNRLARVATQAGIPAFHVETEQELDLDRLSKYGSIGLTAGASTPEWMIERVLKKLEQLKSTN